MSPRLDQSRRWAMRVAARCAQRWPFLVLCERGCHLKGDRNHPGIRQPQRVRVRLAACGCAASGPDRLGARGSRFQDGGLHASCALGKACGCVRLRRVGPIGSAHEAADSKAAATPLSCARRWRWRGAMVLYTDSSSVSGGKGGKGGKNGRSGDRGHGHCQNP